MGNQVISSIAVIVVLIIVWHFDVYNIYGPRLLCYASNAGVYVWGLVEFPQHLYQKSLTNSLSQIDNQSVSFFYENRL